MNKNYLLLFITTLLLMPFTGYLIVDTFSLSKGMSWLVGILCVAMIVLTFAFYADKSLSGDENAPILPAFKRFRILLVIVFILALIPVKQPIKLYNDSVVAYNAYTQKCQQREGFYDNMYKTYVQKKDISFLNYGQFKEIATIIMENKKDGASLAWKWLSEQKVIPFEEFTSFWRDLSGYVQSKRDGYYALEVECQQLANANNTLLSTFPNKFYNFFLGRPHAVYKYGFTSAETKSVFASGEENLK